MVYERKWDAVWIRAQDIISEGILISPRMTSDHYTTTLIGALQVRAARGNRVSLRQYGIACDTMRRVQGKNVEIMRPMNAVR